MASLFIQIDKPFYFAGDNVNGHVFFNLFENMNAKDVIIKFKGWEKVKWLQTTTITQTQKQGMNIDSIPRRRVKLDMDSSDSESEGEQDEYRQPILVNDNGRIVRVHKYTGQKIIAKFKTCLYDFGGNYIPAGQYSFPFSFKTAQTYPASFKDKSEHDLRKGRIKYEMQAFVKGYNQRSRLIKHKTQIVIRETTQIKNQKKQMIANVKTCCCMDQGTSKIECFFEKNAYAPGEDANIHCVLDTKESKVDVTNVTVQLINTITYTSSNNRSKSFSNKLFTRSFKGLPMGQEVQRTEQVKILNDTNPDKNHIMPTARGKYLKSTYDLRVQAVVDASCTCCSDLPVVYQHILIYPYIPINSIFNAPPNWHPEQMPMINLQMAINAENSKINNMNNPYY